VNELDLFTDALTRTDPAERAAFLDRACAGNPDLRRRLEELLAAHARSVSPIDRPPVEPARFAATTDLSPSPAHETRTHLHDANGGDSGRTQRSVSPALGTVIAGRYTLIDVIGEGGMGAVYLAEQTEPVKRQVALKLIRAGMDSRQVLARFDAERQALAMMDHPNIARVYDGGAADGQPFFVMELVRGVPLTDYCDQQRLSVKSRLELFVSVCQAVQHAHQKGIIHRDLKPGNVLVTEVDGRPTPKVIDFGVAKATELQLTDMSYVDAGAIVGTPAYMSPEQADPTTMDIDTRTDVYALGVMLYELLVGSPPLDARQFKQGAVLEMLRMVREVDPPKPSTKLSTVSDLPEIAAKRSVEPSILARSLQGELDWVVMKALEKDRTRRYDSANGLARDLQRYLADEVVEARPASRLYRLKKLGRRHQNILGVALGAAATAGLLLVACWFTWQRYDDWRKGRLFLASDGTAATAELFHDDGTSAGPPFSLPTEEPLSLPAGEYQLRLRGRGFLEESYRVRVDRAVERAYDVSLADQRLWKPMPVPRCYELAELNGRRDVFVLSETGVSRRHGGTGQVLWEADLREAADPKLAGFKWDWDTKATPTGRGDSDRRPALLKPCTDLNGDGAPDLIWVSRRQAAVLALSGVDGKVLWCYQAAPPQFGKDSRFNQELASTGAIIGLPIRCTASSGPALVITGIHQKGANGVTPRWVAALSGRDGKLLWRYDLPGDWFRAPPGQSVPVSCQWPNLIGVASGVSSASMTGPDMLYEKDFGSAFSGLPAPYPAQLVRLRDRSLIAVSAGVRLLLLDPLTGRPLGEPLALGFWPERAPQFVDLDGDGRDDVVLLGPPDIKAPTEPAVKFVPDGPVQFVPDGPQAPPLPDFLSDQNRNQPSRDDRLSLSAFALDSGRELWRHEIHAYWGWNWNQEPFEWPIVCDLSGEGKPDVVVPTGDFSGSSKWAGVELRDGRTGEVRWQRLIERSTRFGQLQQVNRIVVGPDLDGDGCRDLFLAVLDGSEITPDKEYSSFHFLNFDKDYNKPVLRIDALSGRDGRSLWWSAHKVRSGSLTSYPHPYVGPLQWWHSGADGWPLLVAPYIGGLTPAAYVVSSRNGSLWRLSPDLPDPRVADLDGDGVPDLVSFRLQRANAFDRGGTLDSVRGRSPEQWRLLGGRWKLGPDLDGDGIPDLIADVKPDHRATDDEPTRIREAQARPKLATVKNLAEARSGRDGRVLWRTEITEGNLEPNWNQSRYERLVPAGADLDGDGVPDLLATIRPNMTFMNDKPFSPVVAISGRTGERIWSSGFTVEFCNGPQLLACHDLNGDGRPEVLVVLARGVDRLNGARSTNDWQYWLAVLDGETGTLKWKQPLSICNPTNQSHQPSATPFSYSVADLDGDGLLDVVIEGGLPNEDGDVRAFRGTDGEPLWNWKPSPRPAGRSYQVSRPTIVVADLKGNGRAKVLVQHNVTEADAKPGFDNRVEVLALDGRNGAPLWSWRKAVEYDYNNSENSAVPVRCTPLLVRRGGGRNGVCVWTSAYVERGYASFVTVLDDAGREVASRPVAFRLSEESRRYQREQPNIRYSPIYSGLFRVWAADLDGNGVDELLVFENDKLVALRSDLKSALWEHPLPDAVCDLLKLLPGGPAVRLGGQIVGLDGKTGRTTWTCAGSGTPIAFLAPASDAELPRVVFDLGDEATVCRRATAMGAAEQLSGFEPFAPSTSDDPRYVKPLPWNALIERPPLFPASPFGIFLWLAGICFVVIVAPVGLVRLSFRRRSVWPAAFALLWLVMIWSGLVACYWLALNDDAALQISTNGYSRFAISVGKEFGKLALIGLPAVAVLAVAFSWFAQGRKLRLGLLVAASLILAGAIGLIWTYADGPEDGQRYATSGWWRVAPAGVYAVGVLLTVGWLGKRAWGWRKWRPWRWVTRRFRGTSGLSTSPSARQ
jgi:serine/threonine protein kinase